MSNKVTSADNQQERVSVYLDPTYVVGLVDGEGYFSIRANKRKQGAWKLNDVRFTFGVKLRADDGKTILKSLQKFFDCGTLSFRRDLRKNFCNCYEFQVRSHRDIFSKIIPFFQKHELLFPSKRRTFRLFCRVAQMVKNREHIQAGGIARIKKIAKRLH